LSLARKIYAGPGYNKIIDRDKTNLAALYQRGDYMADSDRPQVKGTWLNVFCPEARCLSEAEVQALPPDMAQAPGVQDKQGLWLKVFCPDESCLSEAEKGSPSVPVLRTSRQAGHQGLWLELFCPDGACQVDEDTDLP